DGVAAALAAGGRSQTPVLSADPTLESWEAMRVTKTLKTPDLDALSMGVYCTPGTSGGSAVIIAPAPLTQGGGPSIESGPATAAVADVAIVAEPKKLVRLEVTPPKGKKVVSGSPYKNRSGEPGTWKVMASAAGYEDYEATFHAPVDDVTEHRIELKELNSLEVTGTPEGASVTVTKGVEELEWVDSKYAEVSFARTETTVAQYRDCVEAGKCEAQHHKSKSDHEHCNWGYEGRDDHPMNCVDWYGAEQFCEWAGGRLPTEEEWESEAGAGGTRVYPWGNKKPSCSLCVMDDGDTTGSAFGFGPTDGCGEDSTWPVCSKRQGDSVSGLCDMAGNVWEWTSSQEDSSRIVHGGAWYLFNPGNLKVSSWYRVDPTFRDFDYGFRCVVPKAQATGYEDYLRTLYPPEDDATVHKIELKELGGLEWAHSKYAKVSFARSETTVAQYGACVEAGKCEFKHHKSKFGSRYCNWGYEDRDDHPMNCVDWYGAEQFCEWVGGRLPTEQEWEAEASAGGRREYPWGRKKPSCSLCVMDDSSTIGSAGSETDGCGENRTWPVCSKRRGNSVSGLCDMAGNVWEWTSSWSDFNMKFRVLRGGSWLEANTEYVSASDRNGHTPDRWDSDVGFRCVVWSRKLSP
ncbi:MAG: formylglycine-generating enzyme family protein, partial [Pseudomonadota bacterium]